MSPGGGATAMVVERDLIVAARDGVGLATDIYRPPGAGPFPVILERTPYDKSAPSRSERTAAVAAARSRAEVAAYFVARGYALAYQDCRGRYGSGGRFTKYLSEAEDGYDTLAWLVRQPWCNGRVATMGLSYSAHTQMALGCLNPPGLAAQFFDCGGFSNAYRSGIRHGGAFDLKQATWAYRNALADTRDPAVKEALAAQDIAAWIARLPQRPWTRGDSPLAAAPEYEDYLFEQWSHGNFDAFWRQPGIYAEGYYDRYPDLPMVHLSGWYDPYARTAMENYQGLAPGRRGPVQLILGPWTHGDRSLSHAGDVEFGPAAAVDGNLAEDFFALRLRWFDRWVRGVANGVEREPAVRVFVMGGGSGRKNAAGRLEHGGRWREAADWPLPGTEWTRFYLGADRGLAREPGGAGAAPLLLVADPRDPVPTIGGAVSSGEPVMRGGAYDQRTGPDVFGARPPYGPLAARPDVLSVATPPLAEDLEIAGPIELRLWIAGETPDADIHAKLVDLYPPSADYPDGFALNLTEGVLRLRYRDSWEEPSPLRPGEVYPVTLALFPTANLFRRGHRLRLDLAGSNFPHFDINPNSGEPEGSAGTPQIARTRIFVDTERSSHLLLPVLPPPPDARRSFALFSCRCQRSEPIPLEGASMTWDILIRGGTVIDGSGRPGESADLAIADGRIARIGANLAGDALRVIDAEGLAVTPGFIDIKTHSDFTLPINPKAESKIRQGVTTEIIGHCGFSVAPCLPGKVQILKDYLSGGAPWLPFRETSFPAYLDSFPAVAVNAGMLVGHNTLRLMMMGLEDRAPTPAELQQMKDLLDDGLSAGALGLSTGLFTPPGSFAEPAEIMALCEVVAHHKAGYFTHLRDESNRVLEALEEAIAVARAFPIHVEIVHLKCSGVDNWGKAGQILDRIEAARMQGCDIDCDAYPYAAGANPLKNLLPPWVQVGGNDAMLARLGLPETRARIEAELADHGLNNWGRIPSWEAVQISISPKLPQNAGKTVAALAAAREVEPVDLVCDHLIEDDGATRVLITSIAEDDIRTIVRSPKALVGSDGNCVADYGIVGQGMPHPRFYGTFPRIIGHYVAEERLLPLEQAVYKMTGGSAGALKLRDRGLLAEGWCADVAIFDPADFRDRATYAEPHRYPTGPRTTVIVNGVVVVDNAVHTGALPGKVLRRASDGTLAAPQR